MLILNRDARMPGPHEDMDWFGGGGICGGSGGFWSGWCGEHGGAEGIEGAPARPVVVAEAETGASPPRRTPP